MTSNEGKDVIGGQWRFTSGLWGTHAAARLSECTLNRRYPLSARSYNPNIGKLASTRTCTTSITMPRYGGFLSVWLAENALMKVLWIMRRTACVTHASSSRSLSLFKVKRRFCVGTTNGAVEHLFYGQHSNTLEEGSHETYHQYCSETAEWSSSNEATFSNGDLSSEFQLLSKIPSKYIGAVSCARCLKPLVAPKSEFKGP